MDVSHAFREFTALFTAYLAQHPTFGTANFPVAQHPVFSTNDSDLATLAEGRTIDCCPELPYDFELLQSVLFAGSSGIAPEPFPFGLDNLRTHAGEYLSPQHPSDTLDPNLLNPVGPSQSPLFLADDAPEDELTGPCGLEWEPLAVEPMLGNVQPAAGGQKHGRQLPQDILDDDGNDGDTEAVGLFFLMSRRV